MASPPNPRNGKPFRSLGEFLKERFGEKVGKVCLDGGFSCPNRDGTLSTGGCLFCDEYGSGAFAGTRCDSIPDQILAQKELVARKWRSRKFVAYFQSFTNTYAPVPVLRRKFEEALAADGIVGLAVATRPDALPPDVIELLADLSERTFLWVELGLQTMHEGTARLLNRGFPLPTFDGAVAKLRLRGIHTVAHLILGLPGESTEDMRASVRHCVDRGVDGLKLHMLHVHRDTSLHRHFLDHPFPLLEQEEYVNLVADLIESLPPHVVLHRITGDGDRKRLVAPLWCLEKKRVYTRIISELFRRKTSRPFPTAE